MEFGNVGLKLARLDRGSTPPTRGHLLSAATKVLIALESNGLLDGSQVDVSEPKWAETRTIDDDTAAPWLSHPVTASTRLTFQRRLDGLRVFGNGVSMEFDNAAQLVSLKLSWRKVVSDGDAPIRMSKSQADGQFQNERDSIDSGLERRGDVQRGSRSSLP